MEESKEIKEDLWQNFKNKKSKNFPILFDILKAYYPEATCSLDFVEPFELVVAVMLSAQCTDERVNRTTKDIFPHYSTPEDFAKIPLETLETLIHPCGFYQTKAKNIKATAQKIVEDLAESTRRYGEFDDTSWCWTQKCQCDYVGCLS